MSKLIYISLLLTITLTLLTVTHQEQNTRVLVLQNKETHQNKLKENYADLFKQFDDKFFSSLNYLPTTISSEDKQNNLVVSTIMLNSLSTQDEVEFKEADDCSNSSYMKTKSTELTFKSDGKYDAEDVAELTFSVNLNNLKITKELVPNTVYFKHSFSYDIEFKTFQFLGSDITKFMTDNKGGDVLNAAVKNTIDILLTDRVNSYAVKSQKHTTELNTSLLPDGLTRNLLVENNSINCDAKANQYIYGYKALNYYSEDKTDYKFDSAKSASLQKFTHYSLINDLLQSKVKTTKGDLIFNFECSANTNCQEYLSLNNFTVLDLMNVFPKANYNYSTNSTFKLNNTVVEALFTDNSLTRDFIMVVKLKSTIVVSYGGKDNEFATVYSKFKVDYDLKNEGGKLSSKVKSAKLLDIETDYSDVFYANVLNKHVSQTMNNYLAKNIYTLFDFDSEGLEFEVVKGQGLLLYKKDE